MNNLSKKAQKILKRKYTINDEEDWNTVCVRIADHISSAENEENRTEWLAKFFQLINERVFLPGGRIIANAGTKINNLANCYVLDIEDSREGIYNTLTTAAEVFSQGGGVGYNFSKLREKDAPLSTGGGASGPIAFMKLFNDTGELIQQNSRRAAQMGQLNIWHPDILEFIRSKALLSQENKRLEEEFLAYSGADKRNKEYKTLHRLLLDNQLTYFNISVMLTDDFIIAVEEDLNWDLISPKPKQWVKTVKARDLLQAVAQRAWESGDPGIGFIDRINQDNMVPYLGEISASNPCGEIYMLPGESCVLGAINLVKVYDKSKDDIDWRFLEYIVRTSIRFLDDVIEQSHTGIEFIDKRTKGLRRLGLGIMGWADLLAELEIPYDDPEALRLAEYMSWYISFASILESHELAKEKGEFNLADKEKMDFDMLERLLHSEFSKSEFDIKNLELRNVSVTSIAPTGSISLLADVNSGIEPFFMLAYKRNITDGQGNIEKDSIIEINEILLRKLSERGFSKDEIKLIKDKIVKTGSIQGIKNIPQDLKDIFRTSHEIGWESHIDMQAAWQKFVTNSISKTINFPQDATVENIYDAIIYAWKSGLKGLALYRTNSKIFQILNKIN